MAPVLWEQRKPGVQGTKDCLLPSSRVSEEVGGLLCSHMGAPDKAAIPGSLSLPFHSLTEQHDNILLHVVLPGGLHGHHGRDVAADREALRPLLPRIPNNSFQNALPCVICFINTQLYRILYIRAPAFAGLSQNLPRPTALLVSPDALKLPQ